MKFKKEFILSTFLLFLLAISSAAADGNGDDMGSGHMGSDEKMMNMTQDGFEGFSDHMKINGDIQINESVKLIISAEPNDEMEDMMEGGMMGMGGESDMMSYTNMMTVSLSKLVEFEDTTGDGYSEDDVFVSQFVMNKSTMEQVEIISGTNSSVYIINSNSDIIKITVEMLSENGSPYAFKWSLNINYPFVRSTSKLAVLHDLETSNMDNMVEGGNQMDNLEMGYNMMSDEDEHLPMFFSWDEKYVVDSIEKSVIANFENNIFSLSFDQGTDIYYDPQLGFDPSDIMSIDESFNDNRMGEFWETVNTPTSLGLILGSFALGILFTTFIVKRSK